MSVEKAARKLVSTLTRRRSPVRAAIYADERAARALAKLEEALEGTDLTDDEEITGGQAAIFFGVSREAISKWRKSRLIRPIRRGGRGRGGFVYRAGDVRRLALKK